MNRKKVAGTVLSLFAVMVVSAFTATMVTIKLPVARFGPFWGSSYAQDSARGWEQGGYVNTYIAAAANTLYVGDIVYLSANNAVAKSATAANYNAVAGVVVGGASTSNRTAPDSADLGTLAGLPGKRVFVARSGRAWVRTADSVYVGNPVMNGTVAGRAIRKAATLDSLMRTIGRAVFTIDSGKPLLVNVNVK